MDTLSAVLAPVRLQQTLWASTTGRGAWGFAFATGKHCVRFHYVVRGRAWLGVDRTEDAAVELSAGELVVLPRGHAHALRDDPRTTARGFGELMRRASPHAGANLNLELGTKGKETRILTGAFVLDDPIALPILQTLPPLIRMRPGTDDSVPSLLENFAFIGRELDGNRPGSDIVLLRMADVLFIQILRSYLAKLPDDGGGFLGALRDAGTGGALGAMHRRPDAPWTVASLAKEAGLSRSVFAARFTQLVGEPPLGYLTRLRMQTAATLLAEGATLAKASRGTGYASEASFSHAFRQWAGVAPGAWRRRRKQA